MSEAAALRAFIVSLVQEAVNASSESALPADENTPLLGAEGVLDSLALVRLLVEVEDYCTERGLPFAWPSASALSPGKSPFRTARALAEYVEGLGLPSP